MRIVLDATPLTVPKGGTARYTWELASALARVFPDDEVMMVSDQPVGALPPGTRRGGGPRSAVERKWWLVGLPRELARLRAAVFHSTDFTAPYRGATPAVMSVLDLSPWMDPAWHSSAGRVRRRAPWLLRLGRVSMVITQTDVVRKQVLERFRLRPERVRTVPLAAAPWFRPTAPARRDRPYFLFVGTLEPRKNVSRIVEAWRVLKDRAGLLLAGRRRADGPVIPEEPGLEWLDTVEDEQLPGLYSGCVAALMPSFYEGFGLPVLEAMQCGAPVITSRDAALLEVGAGAALHAEAGSTAEWVTAMRRLLDSEWERRELSAAGLRRAAEFTWERTARETHRVYEAVVGDARE